MDIYRRITALRMERQHLTKRASKEEYDSLYRDLQPGTNVYWNGFGDPPSLWGRAAFDDKEYNRRRQADRRLVKGRFAGGNIGWIVPEDMELFLAVYRKPLGNSKRGPADYNLRRVLELIEREGPLNIRQIKDETGLLVKEITPALHRLQEAFLVYEDQYDGEWDRGWYRFDEIFPDIDPDKYSRAEALPVLLERFVCRLGAVTEEMAKSWFRLPAKDIKAVFASLAADKKLTAVDDRLYMLTADLDYEPTEPPHSVFALHRNDILYRASEPELKAMMQTLCDGLEYDCEPLQYLLVDGKFIGASVGHFRNGPYDLNDIRVADGYDDRRDEIIKAVADANYGKMPIRFMGEKIRN